MSVPGEFGFQDLMSMVADILTVPLIRDGLLAMLAIPLLLIVLKGARDAWFRA